MAKSDKTCMEQAEIIDTFGTYQHFIEAPVWEALNVIQNLVGSLPIASIKEDITLVHIMKKLEKLELEMPSIDTSQTYL